MPEKNKHLARFGFSFQRGGAHTARTMMLEELGALLTYVDHPKADRSDYLQAIDDQNCLGKRSGKTRVLTYRHLVDLYSLDRAFAPLPHWGRSSIADTKPPMQLLMDSQKGITRILSFCESINF
jgi:hypothetical protein